MILNENNSFLINAFLKHLIEDKKYPMMKLNENDFKLFVNSLKKDWIKIEDLVQSRIDLELFKIMEKKTCTQLLDELRNRNIKPTDISSQILKNILIN